MSTYTLQWGRVIAIDGSPAFAITRVPSAREAVSMSPVELDQMAHRIVELLTHDGELNGGMTVRQLLDEALELLDEHEKEPRNRYWLGETRVNIMAALTSLPSEKEPEEMESENNRRTVCQNCSKEWLEDELNAIEDIFERVSAGEPMPAGECPECGALCQLKKEEVQP